MFWFHCQIQNSNFIFPQKGICIVVWKRKLVSASFRGDTAVSLNLCAVQVYSRSISQFETWLESRVCFFFREFPFQRIFLEMPFHLCWGRGHNEPDSRFFFLIHASFIRVCISGSKWGLLWKRSNRRESPVGLRASQGESTYFFVKVIGHIQSIKQVVCNRTHESRQTYSLSGLIFGKYIDVMYFFLL